jgi:Replicase family
LIFKQQFAQVWKESYQVSPTWCLNFQESYQDYRYVAMKCGKFIVGIAVDIDSTGITPELFSLTGLPIPSSICWNPASGHCHAIYLFESPVKSPSAKQANFLRDVTRKLIKLLNIADIKATDRTSNSTQNPYHYAWAKGAYFSGKEYSLGELNEYVDTPGTQLLSFPMRSRADTAFEMQGRNCYAFAKAIKHTQKALIKDIETIRHCVEECSVVATKAIWPDRGYLPEAEIITITASIHRYNNDEKHLERRKASQSKRVAAAASRRSTRAPTTVSQRVRALGVSKSTYYEKRLNSIVGAVAFALEKGVPASSVPALQESSPRSPFLSSLFAATTENTLPYELTHPPDLVDAASF